MANNHIPNIWDDQKLVDTLIECIKRGDSYISTAKELGSKFGMELTPSSIAGKVGRLRKAGVVFPTRTPALKHKRVNDIVKDAVLQEIKEGHTSTVIMARNDVSESYVHTQRKRLIDAGELDRKTPVRRAEPRQEVRMPPVPKPAPNLVKAVPKPAAFAAVIIPFQAPAHRQPHSQKTCEFLLNDKRPWLRCTDPTAYHTSWCNEHGKKVFIVWPPKNYQTEGQKYG